MPRRPSEVGIHVENVTERMKNDHVVWLMPRIIPFANAQGYANSHNDQVLITVFLVFP